MHVIFESITINIDKSHGVPNVRISRVPRTMAINSLGFIRQITRHRPQVNLLHGSKSPTSEHQTQPQNN